MVDLPVPSHQGLRPAEVAAYLGAPSGPGLLQVGVVAALAAPSQDLQRAGVEAGLEVRGGDDDGDDVYG